MADPIVMSGPSVDLSGSNVVELIRNRVRLHPRATAIASDDFRLTYLELWRKASAVASALERQKTASASVVATTSNRCDDLGTMLLGVLLAGMTYMPVDSRYPQARIAAMLDNAQPTVIIGREEELRAINPSGIEALVLDSLHERDREHDIEGPSRSAAYLMYTSGSSGAPKGVLQSRRTLDNLARYHLETSGFSAGPITGQYASSSFDVSVEEVLSTLVEGGTLIGIPEVTKRDPLALWELVARHRVERLFLPVVSLQALANFSDDLPDDAPVHLKEIISVGERLQCGEKVRVLFRRLGSCRLINNYGPTETHLATYIDLGSDPSMWESIPSIGRPIHNVRVIIDTDGGPADGEGELLIGGAGVAIGYRGMPELTASRFVRDSGGLRSRLYRSGDLVRARPDGTLHFCGRTDDQVKIRGFRVEPAEVELAIEAHQSVAAAVVVAAGDNALDRHLAAFVVPARGERPGIGDLRSWLMERLPEFALPRKIHIVASLPRSPNGKVDRAQLRDGAIDASPTRPPVP